MDKRELLERLQNEIDHLTDTVRTLEAARFFERSVPDKWSAAENVHHLMLAVRPLNLAFSLPLTALWLFGKPRQMSRTYEEMVAFYQQRLREGAKASLPYIPPKKFSVPQADVMKRFHRAYATFSRKVNTLNEENFDRYLLPHPIMGKITLREMIYFTIYHVQHHHRIIKERS